ncbi:MAG: hypothetical protein DMD62_15425 [Gemmatimonadetes bacterium]|nr:MAG: hypothetical protein DMD62_15425 [Gemmatimonadota bacterium]
MIRKIVAFAVIAIVALAVLKLALGLLGVVIGLAISLLVLAAMGYLFYLVLRVLSPATAARVREMIRGSPTATGRF